MGICEVCGNDYDKTMDITLGERTHRYDSFECAIHALAPSCGHEDHGPTLGSHRSRTARRSSRRTRRASSTR
jgi:hypothetical protein